MSIMTGLFYLSSGFAALIVALQIAAIFDLVGSRTAAVVGCIFCIPTFVYFAAGCFVGLAS